MHILDINLNKFSLLGAGVVWCGVVCGVVCDVVCGVVWCRVGRCGVVWGGVVWCGAVWYGAVWCGAGRCGVVWCGAVRCGTGQCGVVWYGVVRGGVVWSVIVIILWDGQSRVRIQIWARHFTLPQKIHTGSGSHPAFYSVATRNML
jgi:hypothetical protein